MPPVWADRRGRDYCVKFSGGAVYRITVLLIEAAGVFDVPPQIITADAIGTFLDSGFGQSDENALQNNTVGIPMSAQSPPNYYRDLHWHCIDAQERKCVEFDEHWGIISENRPAIVRLRTKAAVLFLGGAQRND